MQSLMSHRKSSKHGLSVFLRPMISLTRGKVKLKLETLHCSCTNAHEMFLAFRHNDIFVTDVSHYMKLYAKIN